MNRIPLFSVAAAFIAALFAGAPDASASIDAAREAFQKRDLPRAAALLEPLTAEGTTDAAACHLASQVWLEQKDSARAVTLAQKAVTLDGGNAEYFTQLGLALSRRINEVGFMQKAAMSGKLRKAFERAVELDPKNLTALIGLTRYYVNAPEIAGGSLEKAKACAEKLVALDAFVGNMELGSIAEKQEQPEVALNHYQAAAELKPDHVGALARCGRVLGRLGRTEEARARFEAALKLDPNNEGVKRAQAALRPAK
ncbi:tetratricopeptide repeat protein [Opitutus sp. ER46]|uniref:tetratricopeptide repeat protein n=1 Tax=Opitutus sp. ER46 TaxID=2161864 RepID=UPI000D2F7A70|nr:tetratricopeptide repeat protein [Opitutus sp. ER46]PTX97787.1 hypothetical protein DB354_05785 [Opitutus sp. ER46]